LNLDLSVYQKTETLLQLDFQMTTTELGPLGCLPDPVGFGHNKVLNWLDLDMFQPCQTL